jgi:hypothetical protein
MIEYKEEGKPSEIQECVTSAPKFEISGKQLTFINDSS